MALSLVFSKLFTFSLPRSFEAERILAVFVFVAIDDSVVVTLDELLRLLEVSVVTPVVVGDSGCSRSC